MDRFDEIISLILSKTSKNVILANGEFPQNSLLIELLKMADKLVCCDGAIHHLDKYQIIPNYIIGDCDSLTNEIKNNYQNRIIQLAEQNTNDLTKAVNFVVNELKLDSILILGATNLREDHALANISLLVEYAKLVRQVVMLSDYGVFMVCNGTTVIPTLIGQQVSIFAVDSNTHVSSLNLKWELSDLCLDSWYKGTLNQALSNQITLKSDKPILVYMAFTVR